MISLCPDLLYSLKIWCVKNVQNFTDVPQGDWILKWMSTIFLITPRISYGNTGL